MLPAKHATNADTPASAAAAAAREGCAAGSSADNEDSVPLQTTAAQPTGSRQLEAIWLPLLHRLGTRD
jgi:hypothetical protein